MTEKDLEEMKQKYGFTLHPRVFNGKPIKYVSKESSERDKRLTLYAMGRYGYFKYMTSDMDIDEILNKCEVIK